ncbi:MAG: enoyl-CoA hydratase/isomerase family protein [Thermodesulfobacteriota bacterium]
MTFITHRVEESVAWVKLNRGKVNAINEAVAEELRSVLEALAGDDSVKAVVLTGEGSFFSFGLDIPEFVTYSKESFTRFVEKFADLYTYVFLFPKAVVAALNGHTIAGGCMIAIACDCRIMVTGKARISLNEVTFGSSLFPGSAEMLKHCVGARNAESVAFTGAMFSPDAALNLGLIDEAVPGESIEARAGAIAKEYALRHGLAFTSIKKLLRAEVADKMRQMDSRFRDEMIDIWYSEETWKRLQEIKIRA